MYCNFDSSLRAVSLIGQLLSFGIFILSGSLSSLPCDLGSRKFSFSCYCLVI